MKKPFTTLAGEGSTSDAVAAWQALREDPGRERRVRLELPLADGRISKAEVAMTGTTVDGRFAGAHGAVRDISERERLEGDLRNQAAELAASQERSHLARELHDSVTQALFSMGLTLRTLELLLETDSDAVPTKVAELRELQQDALAEMRTLIFELRPSSLESDGLIQALRTHATAVQRRTGLTIVVDAEPVERLPLATEEALYRIGQEAIHNVVKHANASCATIRIVLLAAPHPVTPRAAQSNHEVADVLERRRLGPAIMHSDDQSRPHGARHHRRVRYARCATERCRSLVDRASLLMRCGC